MPDLLATQRAFGAALRDAARSVDATDLFVGDDATVSRRLAIYRGNAEAAVSKALDSAYPVVGQLVGEEFFEGLARRYWERVPSCSGDLTDYGADFADFLAGFAATASFPYLPDLARLEWQVQKAGRAPDAARRSFTAGARLSCEDLGKMHCTLLPGSSIIASSWPIATLWQIHQSDYGGEFYADLERGEIALVARDGVRVTVQAIGRGESAFYRAIQAGSDLARAIDAGMDEDAAWESASWISDLLARAPITLDTETERMISS